MRPLTMTLDDLPRIAIGDEVLIERDNGDCNWHRVRQLPWQLGHGAWVIGVSGISGGYSLDRVREVRSANAK